MEDYNPEIFVSVFPKKVSKGQMISIHAVISDKLTGSLMAFDTIYLEIIDEKGVPVWPLSIVAENTSTISKLISTAELETGKKYLVRVSPSKYRRPAGSDSFQIDRNLLSLALLVPGLALIPAVLFSSPKDTKKEKTESTTIQPEEPQIKIAWLEYVTQKDTKVCSICSENDGKKFRPDDSDLIKIPDDTHPRCRCHYDIISEDEEKEIYQASLLFYYYNKLQYFDRLLYKLAGI